MIKMLVWIGGIVVLAASVGAYYFYRTLIHDPFAPLYAAECASCHGSDMLGTSSGPGLFDAPRILGQGIAQISEAIAAHPFIIDAPVTSRPLEDAEVRGLAILIGETQTDRKYRTFEVDANLEIPSNVVALN